MKITKRKYDGFVYDISVKKNQNLFVNDILAHNCGCWVAKKKYFMLVADSEGVRYKEDHFKSKGIQLVQRSTPDFCKRSMKKALIMMLGDHSKLTEFILDFKDEFYKQDAATIGQTRTVNNIMKWASEEFPYYISGTPAHVRGSLNYNRFIKENNISDEYDEVLSGESAKTIYMRVPNPFAMDENIFAFIGDRFPNIKRIGEYIDYETQFEKTFFKPINDIAEKCNITINMNGETDIDDLEW